jgi:hypothetical protein
VDTGAGEWPCGGHHSAPDREAGRSEHHLLV